MFTNNVYVHQLGAHLHTSTISGSVFQVKTRYKARRLGKLLGSSTLHIWMAAQKILLEDDFAIEHSVHYASFIPNSHKTS